MAQTDIDQAINIFLQTPGHQEIPFQIQKSTELYSFTSAVLKDKSHASSEDASPGVEENESLTHWQNMWHIWKTQPITRVHVKTNNCLLLAAVCRQAAKAIRATRTKDHKNGGIDVYRQLTEDLLNQYKYLANDIEMSSHEPKVEWLQYRHAQLSDWVENRSETGKCLSVVFPCLALRNLALLDDTRKSFQTMRGTIPKDFRGTLQPERTLDEAYFPGLGLEFFRKHNSDQVVSREYRNMAQPKLDDKELKVPIIMVSQLWIWTAGNLVLSAYPDEDSRRVSSNTIEYREHSLYFATLRVLYIIHRHVRHFGLKTTPEVTYARQGPLLSLLDYFEMGVCRMLSDLDDYVKSKPLGDHDLFRERDLLHGIADIRNELAMISSILKQQDDIVQALIKINHRQYREKQFEEDDKPVEPVGWEIIKDTARLIQRYRDRADKIDGDAARIENTIQTQLDLKRTHSNMRDTRNGLILNAAVIGFTLITVIFTPLAFMTSLFSMDIDRLKAHQKGEGNDAYYETSYVVRWFGVAEGASLALTLLAVIVSWIIMDIWMKRGDAARSTEKKTLHNTADGVSSSIMGRNPRPERRSRDIEQADTN